MTHLKSDTDSLRELMERSHRPREFAVDSYYNLSAADLLNRYGDRACSGDRTTWVGTTGTMVRVDPRYVRAIEGNYFDPSKLATVAAAVASGSHPAFGVGLVDVLLIDEGLVEEDQQSFDRDELLARRPLDEDDIGELLFQVRDGNHRVFGALIGGETVVMACLVSSKRQDVNEYRGYKARRDLSGYKRVYGATYAKLMSKLDAMLKRG